MIPALHAKWRKLKFYVREGTAADPTPRLRDGALDPPFFSVPLDAPGLHVGPLCHEPLLVSLQTDHPLPAMRVVDRAAVSGKTVMTIGPGHRLHDTVAALCEESAAQLSLDDEGTSLDTLGQMVATGPGLSILSALYARSKVVRDALVAARPLSDPAPGRDIGMVWRRTAARGGACVTLAAATRATLVQIAPEVCVIG